MLSYFVRYADRQTGGSCETFTAAEDEGKLTLSVIISEFGRLTPHRTTVGRWSFYSGAQEIYTVDLDRENSAAPSVDFRQKASSRAGGWMG